MVDRIAFLWWEENIGFNQQPFDWDIKRKEYEKFCKLAEEQDLELILGDYRWYSNGKLEKAWHWNDGWENVEDVELDGVYDLFKFDEEKQEKKEQMAEEVGIMDDPELTEICQDKLLTYEEFPELVPETRKATAGNLEDMLEKYDEVVLKPRSGSSGEGMKKVENLDDLPEDIDSSKFILQRFVETEGMKGKDFEGIHDIRVLLINNEVMYAYVRSPEEGFRSNLAQGGELEYVEMEDLSEEVHEIVDSVKSRFSEYKPSIYTVDMMFDQYRRPWILELNTQPGVGYHGPERVKEKELPVMREILSALKQLTRE